jgi:protein AFG1
VPDDLYKNGLQRELFLPFIDSIYEYCDVIPLISPTDYRQLKNTTHNRLYFNSDSEKELLDRVVAHFILEQDNKQVDVENINTKQENHLAKMQNRSIDILGREVQFERTYKYLLDTNFAFLCEEARSSVDYLEICKQFDVIILRDIPSINLKNVDSLRRLILFVDTVYDNKIKLVLSGKAATLTGLFDFASKKREKIHRLQEKTQQQASLFTVEEELFAVDRTISRLVEMQSESYLKQLIKRN